MSHSYYYFAASLPMIDFDSKQSLSIEDFLRDCERLLIREDFCLVSELLSDGQGNVKTHNATYNAWADFNRRFRNEMVWFRAEDSGKDPLEYIHGDRYSDPYLVDVIHQAAKKKNLLEGEEMLDRVRWQYLEELSNGQYYNLEFIICYGLKLKILERHQEFTSPKGREVLDELKTIDMK